MAITIATTGRNALCDKFVDLIDYGGTASGFIAVTTSTEQWLCKIYFSNPAFYDAVAGVASGRVGLTGQVTGDGTAARFGVFNQVGGWIFSGAIGAEMTISNTSLLSGDTITVNWTGSTITCPAT